jgi:hypothetical protein
MLFAASVMQRETIIFFKFLHLVRHQGKDNN